MALKQSPARGPTTRVSRSLEATTVPTGAAETLSESDRLIFVGDESATTSARICGKFSRKHVCPAETRQPERVPEWETMDEGTTILCLSHTGEKQAIVEAATDDAVAEATVVGATAQPDSTLGKVADETIHLEQCAEFPDSDMRETVVCLGTLLSALRAATTTAETSPEHPVEDCPAQSRQSEFDPVTETNEVVFLGAGPMENVAREAAATVERHPTRAHSVTQIGYGDSMQYRGRDPTTYVLLESATDATSTFDASARQLEAAGHNVIRHRSPLERTTATIDALLFVVHFTSHL